MNGEEDAEVFDAEVIGHVRSKRNINRWNIEIKDIGDGEITKSEEYMVKECQLALH